MKKIEVWMESIVEIKLEKDVTEREILEFIQNYKKTITDSQEAKALKSLNLKFELIDE